jgi:hypothetical protein
VNKIKALHGIAAVALLSGGSGCGLSSKTPTEEFKGTLGSDWDGQAPTFVQASSRRLYEAPIENGEFRLEVLGQESYRFVVVRGDGSSVPLLFPRAGGATNEELAVSGGTSFDFGYLRYVAPFQSAMVQVSTRSSKTGELETDGEYECEDGIDPNTGAACVEENDDAESCEDDDDEEGEHEDGDEADDEGDDDDIECEDGVDARTGLACEDEDDDHVESREEAALPDHVPPSGVGNCGDDDNVEQEGEHEG